MAKASFFVICMVFALAWAASGPIVGFSHHWIDTLDVVATLVTFIIVALLQNEGWRGNKAAQCKLNAIASALAELMKNTDVDQEHVRQLEAAIGLEKRESSTR